MIQLCRLHWICTITGTLTNSVHYIFQTNKDICPLHVICMNIQYYQSMLDKIWEFTYMNTVTVQKTSVKFKAILRVSLMSHYFLVKQHSKILELVSAKCLPSGRLPTYSAILSLIHKFLSLNSPISPSISLF